MPLSASSKKHHICLSEHKETPKLELNLWISVFSCIGEKSNEEEMMIFLWQVVVCEDKQDWATMTSFITSAENVA